MCRVQQLANAPEEEVEEGFSQTTELYRCVRVVSSPVKNISTKGLTCLNSQSLNPVNANSHVQQPVCSALYGIVWQPTEHPKPEANAFTKALLTVLYADVCEALRPKCQSAPKPS